MWIIGFIAAIGGVAVVHLVLPQFQEMFAAFGAELPTVTHLFIDHRMFLWILPLAVPLVSWLLPARETSDRWPGIVGPLVGIAIAIGLPLFCGLAMYLPIIRLSETVQ
jgi:hypothetical protein